MPLPYKPMTEKEDLERNLLEKGEYLFVVDLCELKKASNHIDYMLAVVIVIVDENGKERKIKDWVMMTNEDMKWKFRHFAKTCGLLAQYDANILEEKDFVGKSGIAKIGQKLFKPNDGSDPYMVNNVIDYVLPKSTSPAATLPTAGQVDPGFGDKDVPF